ncbi:unnamed protein product [Phytomonas sp. EM1]|nr:unnamed protein product [Phytomonas sp. EM1]|eukprot:CCW63450.1 unnamed protein product [Phytomonas sp. isolate EM1]
MSEAVPTEPHAVEPSSVEAPITEATESTQGRDCNGLAPDAGKDLDASHETSDGFAWPQARGCLLVASVALFQEVDHSGFRCIVAFSVLTALMVESLGGMCALQCYFS